MDIEFNKEVALNSYNESWDMGYTTMEAILNRIKILSENGAYECVINFEKYPEQCDDVVNKLKLLGFDVTNYNGEQFYFDISWG